MNEKCVCNLEEGEENIISIGTWVNLNIKLKDKEYWIIGVADGNAYLKIDYCPKCGRRLEEEPTTEEWLRGL